MFRDVRYGRPITDWKHTDAPPGTAPHRPVLGRPVDEATLERIRRQVQSRQQQVAAAEQEGEYRVPLVAPRPARPAEVPPSARRMHALAGEYGWTGALVYYQTAVGDEAVVLRLRRRELGAVAVWERRGPNATWKFMDAYTRCHSLTEQVGSEQLKAWLKQRDERCPDCGGSAAAHHQGECP